MPIDEREWSRPERKPRPRREGYGPYVKWTSPTEEQSVAMWRLIAAVMVVLWIIGVIFT